ncbi:MAG: pantoate--beta-alanine ligase [Candidatus Limnocylindrales bacterium]
MIVARTIADARAAIAERRADGAAPVGLVPTMGALHAGHRSLLTAARAECQIVVMSLFVNPSQFGDQADLAAYPRDEAADLAAAEAAGVDVVFAPDPAEMYPPGFQTWVEVERIGATHEGAHRPGHVRGVATIVLKLLHITAPDVAYFGQKDAQQVELVRAMLRDLDLPIRLRVLPTVRDADGLALASRNARLSPSERAQALALPRALATGDSDQARAILLEAGLAPDYVEVLDFDPPVLAAAVRVGKTRLIDNVVLDRSIAPATEADPR